MKSISLLYQYCNSAISSAYQAACERKGAIALTALSFLAGGPEVGLFAIGVWSVAQIGLKICSKKNDFFQQKPTLKKLREKMQGFRPSQSEDWFQFFVKNKDYYNNLNEEGRSLGLQIAMDTNIPKEIAILAKKAGIRFDIREDKLFGNTPLIWAIANANNETALALLNQRTDLDINARDESFGNTALLLAVCKGYRDRSYNGPISVSNVELVKALLKNGADPNLQNFRGDSSYHIACASKDDEMMDLLLEYGANPKIQNLQGQTPPDCANMPNHEAIEMLEAAHDLFVLPPRTRGGSFQLHDRFKGIAYKS